MPKNLSLSILIFTLVIIACERIDLGEAFTAKVGDKFRVNSRLSFSIDSLDDYRCPLLIECLTSGDVKMFCTFYKPSNRIDTAIYLVNTRNSITISGYTFKLLSVNPQSQTGEVIPQNDYRVDLIVQKD